MVASLFTYTHIVINRFKACDTPVQLDRVHRELTGESDFRLQEEKRKLIDRNNSGMSSWDVHIERVRKVEMRRSEEYSIINKYYRQRREMLQLTANGILDQMRTGRVQSYEHTDLIPHSTDAFKYATSADVLNDPNLYSGANFGPYDVQRDARIIYDPVHDVFRVEKEDTPINYKDSDGMYGEDVLTQGELHMNLFESKVVGCRFVDNDGQARSSKVYAYVTDILDLKNDDVCIVVGGSGAPSLVKVVDDNFTAGIESATRMIVCRVDMTAYFEKMNLIIKRKEALKRLEELDREDKAINKFADLAKRNPEAAKLLELLGMSDKAPGVIENNTSEQPLS